MRERVLGGAMLAATRQRRRLQLTSHRSGNRVALVDCPLDADGTERPSPESTVAIPKIVARRNASPRVVLPYFYSSTRGGFLSI
jgi:hypothetical protein